MTANGCLLAENRGRLIDGHMSMTGKQLYCYEAAARAPEEYRKAVDQEDREWPSSLKSLDQINDFRKDYTKRINTHETIVGGLRLGKDVANFALDVLQVGGPGASVLAQGARWVGERTLGYAIDKVDERGKAAALNVLRNNFQQSRAEERKQLLSDVNGIRNNPNLTDAEKGKQTRQRLLPDARRHEILQDFDENARPAVEQYMFRVVEENQRDLGKLINQGVDDIQGDIVDLQGITIGFAEALGEVQVKTQEGVQSIQRQFTAFTDRVEKISGQIDGNLEAIREVGAGVAKNNLAIRENRRVLMDNAQNIGTIKDMMFNQLSYKEQLKAIDSGRFPNQAHKQEAIQAAHDKQKLIETTGDLVNGAGVFMQAADTFGIKIPKDAREAVRVGQAAGSALMAFASGNYLGAASAVIGIFAKKGPDIAGERHKQIMKQFDRLFKGQQKLAEGQRKIMENQQKIMQGLQQLMEGQQKIFDRLNRVAKQIEELRDEVMQALGEIQSIVFFNLQLNLFEARDGLIEARTFLRYRSRHPTYKFVDGEFTSYDGFRLFMTKEGNINRLDNAMRYFAKLFDLRNGIAPFFKVSGQPTCEGFKQQQHFEEVAWRSLIDFYLAHSGEQNGRKRAAPLLLPMRSYQGITERSAKMRKVKEEAVRQVRNIDFVVGYLEHYLLPEALIELSESLIEIQKYTAFVKRPGKEIFTLEELLTADCGGSGKIELENLQKFVDLAIAQQTLLTGDWLIPKLLPILIEGRGHPHFARTNALLIKQVQGHNDLFIQNLMIQYIHEKVLAHPKAEAHGHYRFAFERDRRDLMESAIGRTWKVEYTDKAWWINLGTQDDPVQVLLPTFEQVRNRYYIQSDANRRLVEVRANIASALLDYEAPRREDRYSLIHVLSKKAYPQNER